MTVETLSSSGEEDWVAAGLDAASRYANGEEHTEVRRMPRSQPPWHNRLLVGIVEANEASGTVRDVDGMRRFFGHQGVVGYGARDRLVPKHPTPPILRY